MKATHGGSVKHTVLSLSEQNVCCVGEFSMAVDVVGEREEGKPSPFSYREKKGTVFYPAHKAGPFNSRDFYRREEKIGNSMGR